MFKVPTEQELMSLPTGMSIQRWAQKHNPGISLADAENIRSQGLRRLIELKQKR